MKCGTDEEETTEADGLDPAPPVLHRSASDTLLFTDFAVCFQVHSMYRHTGASFQKAQDEFSQGVITNRSFQSAAATAATSAFQ